MKRKKLIRFAFVLFLMMGFVFGLSVQAEELDRESGKLNAEVLCKDILDMEPIEKTNTFSVEDEKVVSWIRFSYQSSEDFKVSWEWINPAGVVYYRGGIDMEAGQYANYRAWYWIGIQDHDAAKMPGYWKVRIYAGDDIIGVQDFYIEED